MVPFSYDQYKDFRDHTTGFIELAAAQAGEELAGVRRIGRVTTHRVRVGKLLHDVRHWCLHGARSNAVGWPSRSKSGCCNELSKPCSAAFLHQAIAVGTPRPYTIQSGCTRKTCWNSVGLRADRGSSDIYASFVAAIGHSHDVGVRGRILR